MASRGNAHYESHPFGIDTCSSISPLIEKPFINFCQDMGVGWVARYGPRKSNGYLKSTDKRGFKDCGTNTVLSYDESTFLLNKARVRILPVQFKPYNSEKLSFTHGRKIGKIFVDWAIRMGIPKKVHLWCDLEGKTTRAGIRRTRADRCMEYVSGWAYEAKKAGYNVGLYMYLQQSVGLRPIHLRQLISGYYLKKHSSFGARFLSFQSMMPLVTSFWYAPRNVKVTPPCGYSIRQYFPSTYYWTCHNYVDGTTRKTREKCFHKKSDVDLKIATKRPGTNKPFLYRYGFGYDRDGLSSSQYGFPYMWGA